MSGQAELRYDERRYQRRLDLASVVAGLRVWVHGGQQCVCPLFEKFIGGLRVVTQPKGSLRTFGAQTTSQDIIQLPEAQHGRCHRRFDINVLAAAALVGCRSDEPFRVLHDQQPVQVGWRCRELADRSEFGSQPDHVGV